MRTRCPCGQTQSDVWGIKDGVPRWRCRRCGIGRVFSVDPVASLAQYTSGAYTRSETPGRHRRGGVPYADRFEHDRHVARLRLRVIETYTTPPATLWDVGCGNGALVAEALATGWSAQGWELSSAAWPPGEALRQHLRVSSLDGADPRDRHTVDVLTFFDVLEHCLDPMRELGFARALLTPGGLLV